MATAMVRRRPHAAKSGRFRLSPGDVVFFGAFFTARRCVERVAQHADIPVPFPALRRCTEREVQHADSSVAPGIRARSVARSGPSVGAQVAYEDSVRLCRARCSSCRHLSGVFCFAHHVLQASLLPRSPDKEVAEPLQAPVAGRISDVSESSQAESQDVLEYEQPIHELLLREQLAKQPIGTCLNRQPRLNADPVRLAGRCRSELQAPPLDSVSDQPVP